MLVYFCAALFHLEAMKERHVGPGSQAVGSEMRLASPEEHHIARAAHRDGGVAAREPGGVLLRPKQAFTALNPP